MTGFGEAERDTPAGLLRVELKTVNHRFFNTNFRTPPGYDRHEHALQQLLREQIARGHVNCSVTLDRSRATGDGGPAVDLEKARQYREALRALKNELELPGEIDLTQVARFSDLFRAPEPSEGTVVDFEVLEDALREALGGVIGMRDSEGARLKEDLEERLGSMARHLGVVRERAPERLVAERDRLREAVRELGGAEDVDEERLSREIAYLAEKWDINEEIVRLGSHIEAFREILGAETDEPVGKRLGFVLQEMHREANTIGAKANDAEIARAAVGLKEEIERLREQLENIE